MSHELKQVDVRLKLTDKESVFSRVSEVSILLL